MQKPYIRNLIRESLKKYINIDKPLAELSSGFRKDNFHIRKPLMKSFGTSFIRPGFIMDFKSVKFFFLLFFLLYGSKAIAPDSNTLTIFEPPRLEPLSELMYATGMVETMGNTFAYNEQENAAGIFQIRQVRLDDYNRRTGSNYILADMFDQELSEKVFLYFASIAGPYNFERIAKAWNGSGPMTENYWKRLKKYLQ
jgi:hypothetical protein